MNRWTLLTAALVTSIAVNLLLIGFLAARFATDDRPMHRFDQGAGWIVRSLHEPTQEMRESVRTQLEAARPLRRELRQTQERVHRLLQSEEFDAEALTRELAALREVSERYQALRHRHMVETLAQIPFEERRRVHRFMTRMPLPPKP